MEAETRKHNGVNEGSELQLSDDDFPASLLDGVQEESVSNESQAHSDTLLGSEVLLNNASMVYQTTTNDLELQVEALLEQLQGPEGTSQLDPTLMAELIENTRELVRQSADQRRQMDALRANALDLALEELKEFQNALLRDYKEWQEEAQGSEETKDALINKLSQKLLIRRVKEEQLTRELGSTNDRVTQRDEELRRYKKGVESLTERLKKFEALVYEQESTYQADLQTLQANEVQALAQLAEASAHNEALMGQLDEAMQRGAKAEARCKQLEDISTQARQQLEELQQSHDTLLVELREERRRAEAGAKGLAEVEGRLRREMELQEQHVGRLQRDKERGERGVLALTGDLADARRQVADLQAKIGQLGSQPSQQVETLLGQLKGEQERAAGLAAANRTLSAEVEDARRRMADLMQASAQLQGRCESLSNQMAQLQASEASAQQRAASSQTTANAARMEVTRLESTVKALEADLGRARQDRQQAEQQLSTLQDQLARNESAHTELAGALHDAEARAKEWEIRAKELEMARDSARLELDTAQAQVEALNHELDEARAHTDQQAQALAYAHEEQQRLEGELAESEDRLGAVAEECAGLAADKQSLEAMLHVQATDNNRLADMAGQLQAVRESREQLAAEVRTLKDTLARTRADLDTATAAATAEASKRQTAEAYGSSAQGQLTEENRALGKQVEELSTGMATVRAQLAAVAKDKEGLAAANEGLREEAKRRERECQDQVEGLRQQLQTATHEATMWHGKWQGLVAEIEACARQLEEETRRRLDACALADRLREEIEEHKRHAHTLEDRLRQAAPKTTHIDDGLQSEHKPQQADTGLLTQLAASHEHLATLRAQLDRREAELGDALAEMEHLRADQEGRTQELEVALARGSELEAQVHALQAQLGEFKDVLQRPLEEGQDGSFLRLSELQAALDRTEADLDTSISHTTHVLALQQRLRDMQARQQQEAQAHSLLVGRLREEQRLQQQRVREAETERDLAVQEQEVVRERLRGVERDCARLQQDMARVMGQADGSMGGWARVQAETESLRAELARMAEEKGSAEAERDRLQRQLTELQAESGLVNEQLGQAKQDLARAEGQIAQGQRDLAGAQAKAQALEKRLEAAQRDAELSRAEAESVQQQVAGLEGQLRDLCDLLDAHTPGPALADALAQIPPGPVSSLAQRVADAMAAGAGDGADMEQLRAQLESECSLRATAQAQANEYRQAVDRLSAVNRSMVEDRSMVVDPDVKRQLAVKENEIKELKKRVDKLRGDKEGLVGEVRAITASLQAATKANADLQAQMAKMRDRDTSQLDTSLLSIAPQRPSRQPMRPLTNRSGWADDGTDPSQSFLERDAKWQRVERQLKVTIEQYEARLAAAEEERQRLMARLAEGGRKADMVDLSVLPAGKGQRGLTDATWGPLNHTTTGPAATGNGTGPHNAVEISATEVEASAADSTLAGAGGHRLQQVGAQLAGDYAMARSYWANVISKLEGEKAELQQALEEARRHTRGPGADGNAATSQQADGELEGYRQQLQQLTEERDNLLAQLQAQAQTGHDSTQHPSAHTATIHTTQHEQENMRGHQAEVTFANQSIGRYLIPNDTMTSLAQSNQSNYGTSQAGQDGAGIEEGSGVGQVVWAWQRVHRQLADHVAMSEQLDNMWGVDPAQRDLTTSNMDRLLGIAPDQQQDAIPDTQDELGSVLAGLVRTAETQARLIGQLLADKETLLEKIGSGPQQHDTAGAAIPAPMWADLRDHLGDLQGELVGLVTRVRGHLIDSPDGSGSVDSVDLVSQSWAVKQRDILDAAQGIQDQAEAVQNLVARLSTNPSAHDPPSGVAHLQQAVTDMQANMAVQVQQLTERAVKAEGEASQLREALSVVEERVGRLKKKALGKIKEARAQLSNAKAAWVPQLTALEAQVKDLEQEAGLLRGSVRGELAGLRAEVVAGRGRMGWLEGHRRSLVYQKRYLLLCLAGTLPPYWALPAITQPTARQRWQRVNGAVLALVRMAGLVRRRERGGDEGVGGLETSLGRACDGLQGQAHTLAASLRGLRAGMQLPA